MSFPSLSEIPASVVERIGGAEVANARLHIEDNRELVLGGRVRICPMRQLRFAAKIFFMCIGIWWRGRREFRNPVIRENEFAVPGLDPRLNGFTLLHLSDLHIDLDPAFPAILRERIASVAGRYDAAVITGDINDLTVHTTEKALREMRDLLPAFSAPVYIALGNHDSLRDVQPLEEAGYRVLLNESVLLEKNGATLRLAGIDDANIFKTHDIEKALEIKDGKSDGSGDPSHIKTILLSHPPAIRHEAAAAGVDIVLSGHTHGGQICLTKKGMSFLSLFRI
ncbi:MAG: metallophosphoesterase, partial [Kiritimatiellaeota bacterium]|nr:metallophosphoesterase [Kiritimatiellota bacterium]